MKRSFALLLSILFMTNCATCFAQRQRKHRKAARASARSESSTQLLRSYARIVDNFTRLDRENKNFVVISEVANEMRPVQLNLLRDLDTDSDGKVTADEIRGAFRKQLVELTRKIPDRILAHITQKNPGELRISNFPDKKSQIVKNFFSYFTTDDSLTIAPADLEKLRPYLAAWAISKRISKLDQLYSRQTDNHSYMLTMLAYLLGSADNPVSVKSQLIRVSAEAFNEKVAELISGQRQWPSFSVKDNNHGSVVAIKNADNQQVSQTQTVTHTPDIPRTPLPPPSWDYIVSQAAVAEINLSENSEADPLEYILSLDSESDLLW